MKKLIIDGKEIDISFVDNIILEISRKNIIYTESGKIYLDHNSKRYELKEVDSDSNSNYNYNCDKLDKKYDDIVISEKLKDIIYRGNLLNLTSTEYKVFKFIIEKETVCTREDLHKYIYGSSHMCGQGRNMDVIITKIRKKTGNPDIIKNRRGVGFYLSSKC